MSNSSQAFSQADKTASPEIQTKDVIPPQKMTLSERESVLTDGFNSGHNSDDGAVVVTVIEDVQHRGPVSSDTCPDRNEDNICSRGLFQTKMADLLFNLGQEPLRLFFFLHILYQ